MSHFVKTNDYFTIDLNVNEKYFLVSSKWQYNWNNAANTSKWTSEEKAQFHNQSDKLIWKAWSNKFRLKCKGTSDFADKHKSDTFLVNFDIKKVTSAGNWKVDVNKIPTGQTGPSYVIWALKKISLDSEDVVIRKRTENGKIYGQIPVSHEFGHTVGNSVYWNLHGDEYKAESTFVLDKDSIMNIGNQLRKRHLDHLLNVLNDASSPLIPNTEFYV